MKNAYSVETEEGVKIGYTVEGEGSKKALLIHGYPETSLAWRHVVPYLKNAGFQVIVPDMRGAGRSSRPLNGYDKKTLAADMVKVLADQDIHEPVYVAGHDIGMMVAFAMGAFYPSTVKKLFLMEAPIAGTQGFDKASADSSSCWHFHFHQARDVPEALTAGKEAFYLERFFHDLAWNYQSIDDQTFQSYVRAFSQPGAMRAGFELYRAFNEDAAQNKAFLCQGKMTVPVMAATGRGSHFSQIMPEMIREVADNSQYVEISSSAHWIPEENPQELSEAMIRFFS